MKVRVSILNKVSTITVEDPKELEEVDGDEDGFFLGAIGNTDRKTKHWSREVKVSTWYDT